MSKEINDSELIALGHMAIVEQIAKLRAQIQRSFPDHTEYSTDLDERWEAEKKLFNELDKRNLFKQE